MKVSYPEVMWSCTLHFSAVEQIKLRATVSVVISKMVFLSLTLYLSSDASLRYLLIFGTYDIQLIFPPCLPLHCLHIIIPFSLLVFCFLSSFWTLSSHSLYIYTQITFVSFSFYLFFVPILLFHWCIYLFLRQKWAKMQWFNTVQRQ